MTATFNKIDCGALDASTGTYDLLSGSVQRYFAHVNHAFMNHGGATLIDTVANTPILKTLTAGGMAGTISRTCTAPVDRLKVLVQEGLVYSAIMQQQQLNNKKTQQHAHHKVSDLSRAMSIARHVYHNDGALAFWRGNGVNCLKAGPEQAIAFTAREFYIKSICQNSSTPTIFENFVTGALAGTTAQLILYPMEVVKTRIAVSHKGEYKGMADCITQSLRRGGVKDLYRGCVANTVGIFPHRGLDMGTYFTLEATMKKWYTPPQCGGTLSNEKVVLPIYATLGCGMVASTFSQTVTYPLNLIRTKLQTQGVNGRPIKYQGMAHCFMTVLKDEGPRGLFAGILPNMAKAVPSTAISYAVFRKTCDALDRNSTSSSSTDISPSTSSDSAESA